VKRHVLNGHVLNRQDGVMFAPALTASAQRVGDLLRDRGETVAVAEGSAGGLISAALLSVPGASAYFLGGAVVYTAAAARAWMSGAIEAPKGMRGATATFAAYLARSAGVKLGATWGIGEAGAAGPANPYGDPAGHSWVAVAGPVDVTRHLLTGSDDRVENMTAFAVAALSLTAEVIAGDARRDSR
jgi:PncC family amidohydrolase